ncbi:MAG TPA: hypothetical protein VE242_09575, partial [Chthoniobacterales bacterium]|nr:hypothetical protein [Chthoniobacterales bacterium]
MLNISFFIVFSLFLSGTCRAAEQSSTSPAKPGPTAPSPTPISLAEVASQAQSALESLHNIEASLAGDSTAATIAKRLPELRQEIDAESAESAKLLAASPPLELLHRIALGWHFYHNTLSDWNRELMGRAKALDDQIVRLDQMREIWQSTLQSPELSQASPEIRKSTQNLIEFVGRMWQAVKSRRAEVLTMQGRILELNDRVQTVSSSIEEAEAKAVKGLFISDSPPIWSKGTGAWVERSRASLAAQMSALNAYLIRQPTVLLLHLFIIALLALVMQWLRRGVHKWAEAEPTLQRAAPVFDFPVSAAIVLSFLIMVPIHALAPRLFQAILGTALLIPIVLILRRLIDRTLFPILNALVVFYLIDQLRVITAALPLVSRFLLSLEIIAATLFLIWQIRSKRLPFHDATAPKRFAGTLRIATLLCLILLPTAL